MLWFAIKTLMCDRGKALTALVGVVFSLVLIEIQGGLYLGLMRKSRILTENVTADIWVGHPEVQLVDLPQSIPESLINRVRTVPHVLRAEPYVVGNGFASFDDGLYENVWILGCDPQSMLGGGWSFVEGDAGSLRRPDGVSVDQLDSDRLNNPEIGTTFEVNGHKARVVAKTRGILPFTTTPYLFTSIQNAKQYVEIPAHQCSYFLVQIEPGVKARTVAAEIERRIPELRAFTATELGNLSQHYWMRRTGIGISFGAATLLGLLVGLMIVGQSLYALVLDHLSDYATLKAMGADDHKVGGIVTTQALAIAATGSAIGIAVVLLAQHMLSSPVAPIQLPLELLCGGVIVVFVICLLATVLPTLRIRRVDPAIVLQG